jgi:PIN domain nuclease of toxin-antitoxin system
MRLLLDTQLLLWIAQKSTQLPVGLLKLVRNEDNELIFSVASIWEFGIKYAKSPEQFGVSPHELRDGLLQNGYTELEISGKHVLAVLSLPRLHGDPFDRLLIAQAIVEGITLLTTDRVVAKYDGPIRRI